MEDDKETDEHEEVEEDDEAELKKHLVIVKDDEIAIDAIPLATKPPVIVEYKLLKEGIMLPLDMKKGKPEKMKCEEERISSLPEDIWYAGSDTCHTNCLQNRTLNMATRISSVLLREKIMESNIMKSIIEGSISNLNVIQTPAEDAEETDGIALQLGNNGIIKEAPFRGTMHDGNVEARNAGTVRRDYTVNWSKLNPLCATTAKESGT
ncbi:hypothetical protein Tco_1561774 [Tanacetum coccineum]